MNNMNEIELKNTSFNSRTYLKEHSIKFLLFDSNVKNKIDEIEKSALINRYLFRAYSLIEQDILQNIPRNKHRKIHKETLRELLYSSFIKKDTETRLKRVKMVNAHFAQFLLSIDLRRNFKKDFNFDFTYSPFDKSDYQTKSLKTILKKMENCLFDECMQYVMTKCVTDYIPMFLINKQLIKQKVALIWKMQYEIPVHTIKMKTYYGYSYLSKSMINFSLRSVNLFDLTIFNKNLLGKVFKCFYLSNLMFLLSNERNFNHFEKKLGKYLKIMNINQANEISIIQNYVRGKYFESKQLGANRLIVEETKQTFNDLTNLLSNDFRILITERGSEKILFIIFSFSLMMNSLIKINWENDQISFCKELPCSACERQLLLNFLHNIESFIALSDDHEEFSTSALNVNYYLECSIFSSVIKAKASELFDVSMRYKYDISYETMLGFMRDNLGLSRDQTILEQEDKESLFFNQHFNSFERELNLNSKDHIRYALIPQDRDNISTHICICINDSFAQCLLDQLTNINRLVDYYCFDWNKKQSSNGISSFFKIIFTNEHEDMVTKAKYAGKFLAYVISSRSLFKFHTFSLIGISYGATVLKYCINELQELSKGLTYSNDLLNDVLCINGQTDFNLIDLAALNNIITGRIINVYSKQQFNEDMNEMIGSNEIIYNKIENYDISNLMLSKDDFTSNLSYILTKVKFLQ